MKRVIKKIISTLIIVLLSVSYMYPIFTYADTSTFKTYVALGDSIAYGYGLSDRDTESYAAKVAKKYNISSSNFKNLAVSGMTCEEFYEQIQKSEYTNAIKSANLITISIGSNELLGIVIRAVADVTGVSADDPDFVTKAQNAFLNASAIQKVMMLNKIYKFCTSEETKVTIENAIKKYEEKWKQSVEYIKNQNPDVVIVATEFYNPYYEVAFASWDISGFVDEYIKKMNVILTSYSNSEKEYKIAKIYSSFNTTNPRVTNVNIATSNFNIDPHPNTLGHEIICTKVLDALSSITVSKKAIESLGISEITDQTYTGKAIEPEITIRDGETILIKNKDYTVSYSNNINIGEAKIIITGIGNYTGSVTKTFNIKEKERKDITKLSINTIEEQVYTGIKITPEVKINDQSYILVKDKDYQINYSNNIDVGTANITVIGIGDYKGTLNSKFSITEKNINEVNVENILDQKYTGQEIKPEIIITNGSIKLQENKDYTISYNNNVNAGTANVTITGKENYKGTVVKQFNIINENQNVVKNIADTTITDIEDRVYTGKLITPEVRIKDGENILIKDKDYTISYSNNINIGTAVATITGIGDYSGKVEKTFNIIKKDIKYTTILDIEDQKYTGNNITPEVIITSDFITLKQGQDYTVKYVNNIDEGIATIQITGIGNYEGTTTKTFNIVKEKDENAKEDKNDANKDNSNDKSDKDNNDKSSIQGEDNKDTTIADTIIPNSGIKLGILSVILVLLVSTVIFLQLYKRNKDIN